MQLNYGVRINGQKKRKNFGKGRIALCHSLTHGKLVNKFVFYKHNLGHTM